MASFWAFTFGAEQDYSIVLRMFQFISTYLNGFGSFLKKQPSNLWAVKSYRSLESCAEMTTSLLIDMSSIFDKKLNNIAMVTR
ncbi:unnamed protein product [Clonostachys byssicola]|uniref:Uncharacterized protein n=1 Tax=Clonostachys byssicola TaxID=160290 RepID=A0A9N9U9R6_9HYPO|nr:unnamed protein product [Clonostachys byssicola]